MRSQVPACDADWERMDIEISAKNIVLANLGSDEIKATRDLASDCRIANGRNLPATGAVMHNLLN
jgi:hypothetical protein